MIPGDGNKNVNRVVRQRLLKWVAKAATADSEDEIQMRMKRHTVNWYRENAKCICNAEDPKECRCMKFMAEEEINPNLKKILTKTAGIVRVKKKVRGLGSDVDQQTTHDHTENGAVAESETHIGLVRMGTETDQLAIHVEPDDHDTATSKHSSATIVPMNNPESMS